MSCWTVFSQRSSHLATSCSPQGKSWHPTAGNCPDQVIYVILFFLGGEMWMLWWSHFWMGSYQMFGCIWIFCWALGSWLGSVEHSSITMESQAYTSLLDTPIVPGKNRKFLKYLRERKGNNQISILLMKQKTSKLIKKWQLHTKKKNPKPTTTPPSPQHIQQKTSWTKDWEEGKRIWDFCLFACFSH